MTKKILLLIILISVFSCRETETQDVLPNIPVDYIVNMNLPQYSDLLIPGVYKETPAEIGVQGIIIYNFNGTYKAFDLACPHLGVDTCSKMTFDGALWLMCPCDDEKFSIYDGSARSSSISNLAREYHVQVLGSNQLRITNY